MNSTPDKRLHWEATHQVLSTESLFLSDFTPTYQVITVQPKHSINLLAVLEYKELGSSTGWLKRPAVVFNAVG
jgi:hypothetical protein